MGPKRSRKGESSSRSEFDTNRFINKEASERFHSYVISRTVVPERGMAPNVDHLDLVQAIEQRGWAHFVEQPEAAVVPIVREFYANIVEGSSTSFVRGHRIPFDSVTINRLFNLPNFDRDGYNTYASEGVDVEEIIRELCRPGAQWHITRGEAVRFRRTDLTIPNRVWHSFICARLLPVFRLTDVTKEWAILLYALVTGRSIDVGKVIYHSIRHIRRGSTTVGLGHPSLITTLCRHAGVMWGPDEELAHPRALLDDGFIRGLYGRGPGEGGVRERVFAPAQEDPPHLEENVPVAGFDQLSLDARLSRLEARSQRHFLRSEQQARHIYDCFAAMRGGHDLPPPLDAYHSPDED